MAKKNRKQNASAIPEHFFSSTNSVLLLNATLDDATESLQSTFNTVSVQRDVGTKKVDFKGVCVFIAQPQGSEWSMILQLPGLLFTGLFSATAARRLSESSGCMALLLYSEDHSGAMDYEIFSDGQSVEQFASEEPAFRSQLKRKLSNKQMANIDSYEWINSVLVELNAKVIPAYPTCTKTKCQFVTGDVSGKEDWAGINVASLVGDDLPTENFSTD